MRCLICLRFNPRCGRCFLVWGSRVYSVGLIFDAAEMRKTKKGTFNSNFGWGWEKTRIGICHFSNATITDLRWLRSRMYSSSTYAALENQTALSQHGAGRAHDLHVKQRLLTSRENLLSSHGTSGSLHPLTKRVSSAWRLLWHSNRLDFSGHISVCYCLHGVWTRGILIVLVHKRWLLKDHLGVRG